MDSFNICLTIISIIMVIFIIAFRKKIKTFVRPWKEEKEYELAGTLRLPEIVRTQLGVKINDKVDIKILDEEFDKQEIKGLLVRKGPKELIHTMYAFIDESQLQIYAKNSDRDIYRVRIEITPSIWTHLNKVLQAFFSALATTIAIFITLGSIIEGYTNSIELLTKVTVPSIFISTVYTFLRTPTFSIKTALTRLLHLEKLARKLPISEHIDALKQYEEIPPQPNTPAKQVLLTAPHAHPPGAEYYTDAIAALVARKTGARALIGRVSRAEVDLNREESNWHPFRKRIKQLVEKGEVKLILDIHGMRHRGYDIDLGTGTEQEPTASQKTTQLFKTILKKHGFDVRVNYLFRGSKGGTIITTFHRKKDGNYIVEALQIEISENIRKDPHKRKTLITALTEIIKEYTAINP